MERKIREDFGADEAGESVRKRRRFWSRGVRVKGGEDVGDEVPLFAPMPDVHVHCDTSLEAWLAGEMMPVMLPEEMQEGERGQKEVEVGLNRWILRRRWEYRCSALGALVVGQVRGHTRAVYFAG